MKGANKILGALIMAATISGCSTYWPPYQGGGVAEADPVTEPNLPYRNWRRLEKVNNVDLNCLRWDLVVLEKGLAPDLFPADMVLAWKQWGRAAREHAGRLPVSTSHDIDALKTAIEELHAKLQGPDMLEATDLEHRYIYARNKVCP